MSSRSSGFLLRPGDSEKGEALGMRFEKMRLAVHARSKDQRTSRSSSLPFYLCVFAPLRENFQSLFAAIRAHSPAFSLYQP